MGPACSPYLHKLLQGLSIQARVVLQKLELLQLEPVPSLGFCLLLQQLKHCSPQKEVKDIPQHQYQSPAELPVAHCEVRHGC